MPRARHRGSSENMILLEYKGTENLNLCARIRENTIAGEIPSTVDEKLILKGYINPNEIKEGKSKKRSMEDSSFSSEDSE